MLAAASPVAEYLKMIDPSLYRETQDVEAYLSPWSCLCPYSAAVFRKPSQRAYCSFARATGAALSQISDVCTSRTNAPGNEVKKVTLQGREEEGRGGGHGARAGSEARRLLT